MNTAYAGRRSWDWVHPSYRDLVIDKLSSDPAMASHYLARGGISAVSLALSRQGGAEGKREFPLLKNAESWKTVDEVIRACVTEAPLGNALRIIDILISGLSSDPPKALRILAFVTCQFISKVWNEKSLCIPWTVIRKFIELSDMTGRYLEAPKLSATWTNAISSLTDEMDGYKTDIETFVPYEMADWLSLLEIVKDTEPRLLAGSVRRTECRVIAMDYLDTVDQFLKSDFDETNLEECDSRQSVLEETINTIFRLREHFPEVTSEADVLEGKAAKQEDEISEAISELRREDGDDDYYDGSSRAPQQFDVASIFSDL